MRKPRIQPITMVSEFVKQAAKDDRSAALAFFMQEVTGSIFGQWRGRISAADQRALFGLVIGRADIRIDGSTERVMMYVSASYGSDFSCEFDQPWSAIANGILSHASGDIAQVYRYGSAA